MFTAKQARIVTENNSDRKREEQYEGFVNRIQEQCALGHYTWRIPEGTHVYPETLALLKEGGFQINAKSISWFTSRGN